MQHKLYCLSIGDHACIDISDPLSGGEKELWNGFILEWKIKKESR